MKQVMEKLVEKMVLTDPRDLVGLAEIHSLFEKVAQSETEHVSPWAKPIAEFSAEMVRDIIMEDVNDPIGALEDVSSAATALEQLILGGCEEKQIELPELLAEKIAALYDADRDEADPEPVEQQPEQQPAVAESAPLTGDLELTAEFIAEAREHLDSADQCLLTIESQPDDLETINALFRAYHTIKGVAGFLDLTDVMQLAHQTENLLDAARQGQLRLEGDRLDVVFDATDMMKRLVGFIVEALESGGNLAHDPDQPALIARLVSCNTDEPKGDQADQPDEAPAQEARDTATSEASASPEITTPDDQPIAEAQVAPTTPHPIASNESTKTDKAPAATRQSVEVRETVKVDSNRLDIMIDAIGELVIAEAMVTQSPKLLSLIDDDMERRLSHLSKITRELQEMATSLRLMPIRSTFQRMARLARDTAKKLDKRIDFVTSGDETELDKNVVDQIGDPLVHMVRNAVDHGLEDTEEARVQAGKDPVGRVELRAYHKGGSIYIEISDDGAGLDRDRLIAKAIERGIAQEDQKFTDQEAFMLIMEPGFSTAAVVSDVSGRGVGMDVVRKNIQKMRGQIEIQSTPGKGTTFSIRLPLTLAIIEGMVVRVANRRYVIPLLSITRMLRPDESRVPTVFNQAEMLETEEGLIPLHRVHQLFNIHGATTDPTQASVVVVEHDGKRVGLLIDELLGQQQIVIKSLGESMRGIEGIAGGAIMPDGKVGLIMDLDSLIRLAGQGSTNKAAA
jgi:two-component system chemotaxis sensor kinase CheA